MKLKSLIFLFAVCAATYAEAQDLKIKVNEKGKVGFADLSGNEVIKCKYESAQPFRDGIAIVCNSGKYGIIDTRGKEVLPTKYTQITDWTKDLFLLKDDKEMGLANHSGTIVLEVKYSYLSKPNCYGKALIATGGKQMPDGAKSYLNGAKYGIIDSNGTIIIEPKYQGLYEFSSTAASDNATKMLNGKAHYIGDTLVTDCSFLGYNNKVTDSKAGILDRNGRELLKNGIYNQVMMPKNDMVRYYAFDKKSYNYGYYNIATGKSFEVLSVSPDAVRNVKNWRPTDFFGEVAAVSSLSGSTPWYFIDRTGKTVREGYAAVKHNPETKLWAAKTATGKWDVFDENNNSLTSLSGFDDIIFPNYEGTTEVFSVKKGEKYGVVNRSGSTVVPFEYDYALGNYKDFIPVKSNGKWGAVSPTNVKYVPTNFVNIKIPDTNDATHVWVQDADSLYYHYNTATSRLYSVGYKNANNFKDGMALVIPTDMKVEDTQLNRALLRDPNATTPLQEGAIANLITKIVQNPTKSGSSQVMFGVLINTNDVVVMDRPVPTYYSDAVAKEIAKYGDRQLTESEKKNIMLQVTRKYRSYDLQSVIDEDDWNY
ncbi:MAG: WG repeat-containing protein [Prevotella sp.]|nr:WG repeat-containing protein [Prevotella sp.]